MKRKTKKIIGLALAILSIATITIPNVFAGEENDNPYGFHIDGWHNNSHSKSRERYTDDPSDRWKVKLSTTGEGKGTYTTFWLENYTGDNVSKTVDVKQGKGYYYRPSYRKGCRIYVYLTAENNNFNSTTYDVTGYWDEETGVYENVTP